MNPYSALAASDFALAEQALLPTGPAWPRDPEAMLTQLAAALAQPTAAVHASAVDLLEVESDPTQAIAMLPDWEAAWGLPDPCTPLNPSLSQRRAALIGKMVAIGGQSRAYFIAVAAALGYAITITEFQPSVVNVARIGDRLLPIGWRFAWQVNAPAVTVWYARVGASQIGDRFAAFGNAQLECVLNRIKPAHTILTFAYGF